MKFVFLGIYVLLMMAIGLYSMKRVTTLHDFFLGGRNVGPWMSAFAYGTTYFSAVIFIGYAGSIGWGFGISSLWIGIGNAILGSYLAWLVLARRTRRITHHLNVSTMPEFFEKRYQSKNMKIFAALIIFIFMVPYSASVYQGLGYLFEQVFGVPYIYCALVMAILTGFYLLLGGYLATALSDFVQGLIMIGGIVLMVAFILMHPNVGGLGEGLGKLRSIDPRLAAPVGPGGFVPLLSLVLLTSMGSWGLPQMIHKFYAIKDDKAITRATIISTLFAVLVAGGAYFAGSFGRLFLDNKMPLNPVTGIPDADMIMPQALQIALPEWIMGIIVILVLSASMSTLSSLVLVSSSAISMDLIHGIIAPRMKKEKVVLLMRGFCILFVVFSFVIAASKQAAILTLMSFSWGTIAGSFLAPFLYGLYWKGATKAGAWAGLIAGSAASLILAVATGLNSSQAPLIGAVAMVVSLIAVPVVSWMTPKFASSHIEDIYGQEREGNLTSSIPDVEVDAV